jgi:hypothetical protein
MILILTTTQHAHANGRPTILILAMANHQHLHIGKRIEIASMIKEALQFQFPENVATIYEDALTQHAAAKCATENPISIGRCLESDLVLATSVERTKQPVAVEDFSRLNDGQRLILGVPDFLALHPNARTATLFSLSLKLLDVRSGRIVAEQTESKLSDSPSDFIIETIHHGVHWLRVGNTFRDLMKRGSVLHERYEACTREKPGADCDSLQRQWVEVMQQADTIVKSDY